MASDVDDMHHEAMRSFREEAAELHLGAARSRRSFMKTGGLAAAGGALLSVGGGVLRPAWLGGLAAAQEPLTDTIIAGYAQSLELAAVAAYEALAPKLSGEVLGVATMFAGHHGDHAEAFGAIAGDDARPEANEKLVDAVSPALSALSEAREGPELTDQILLMANNIENQAAFTYAAAMELLMDPKYAGATATILPIEAQHATVLAFARGKDPVDMFPTDAFETTDLGDGTDPLKGFDPMAFA